MNENYLHETLDKFEARFGRYVLGAIFNGKFDDELTNIKRSADLIFALLKKVESPIEATIAMELAALKWPIGVNELKIEAQRVIGIYRADFFISGKTADSSFKICIECDGHDFHERTKEQASRDRSRDREMLVNGITVMRFTGAEIHRNSIGCADQIYQYISGLVK